MGRTGNRENARTYTIEQCAQVLGIGRNTAYAAAQNGQIPTIKIGKRLLIPKASLELMLDDNLNDLKGRLDRATDSNLRSPLQNL